MAHRANLCGRIPSGLVEHIRHQSIPLFRGARAAVAFCRGFHVSQARRARPNIVAVFFGDDGGRRLSFEIAARPAPCGNAAGLRHDGIHEPVCFPKGTIRYRAVALGRQESNLLPLQDGDAARGYPQA